jgi:methionyl-tRNA formyltransferase
MTIAALPDAPSKTMTVVFVTPDEPSVMPPFFSRVLPELGGDVAAVAVVSPIYKRSSWLGQAKRFTGAFGVREFAVEALQYGYHRAARHSVKSVARTHGRTVLMPDDVNGPDFLARLRELEPDLVVSVSCPQIFRDELLALPRLGCINVHSALLPHYRGMLPTFWVLANGEPRTGVTVHRMTAGIDGGEILRQRAIEIAADETLHSLMTRSKAVAAELVLETIDGFRRGQVDPLPNPAGEGSYFSFPTRADVRRFKARGRRLR